MPYHPADDKRLAAALDAMMTASDPMHRLGATRNAAEMLTASSDRQLLELLDAGTTQQQIADALGITQSAVSKAEARAVRRLGSSRAHRKYVQRRRAWREAAPRLEEGLKRRQKRHGGGS